MGPRLTRRGICLAINHHRERDRASMGGRVSLDAESRRAANSVRLIRFRGHLPKGGYDVPNGGFDRRRRPRRHFDDDFKAQAVRLVLHEGKTVGAAARDLDLTETALRDWVNRARADRTNDKTGLTTVEREELARLRKEVRILRVEREILRKAAAFFANERR